MATSLKAKKILQALWRTAVVLGLAILIYNLLVYVVYLATACWSLFFANVFYDAILHVDVSDPEDEEQVE